MQVIRGFDSGDATWVGGSVKVLLLTSEAENGQMSLRLARLGGQVEVMGELFTALAAVIDDPVGYGLFVIDCDSPGVDGLEGGRRALQMLGDLTSRIPVILVSGTCGEQRFPDDHAAPTELRAPLSALSLKMGYEHALRDRLMLYAAE